MHSDRQLVALSLNKNTEYFGVLVKRHSDYLFSFCLRICAGQHHQAEEIVQQSFIRGFKYLSSFKNPANESEKAFRNWLTGIAVNVFRDLCGQQDHLEIETIQEPQAPPVTDYNEFFELIRPLTYDEKLLFVLKYIYEYSNQEIADMTDMKLGTIKSKLSRALKRLQENPDIQLAV